MKIIGETYYLWWVVDQEGEVLESHMTQRWDRKAALNLQGNQRSDTAIQRSS
jgi:transposase-like protein